MILGPTQPANLLLFTFRGHMPIPTAILAPRLSYFTNVVKHILFIGCPFSVFALCNDVFR